MAGILGLVPQLGQLGKVARAVKNAPIDYGKAAGKVLPFDPTPRFQFSKSSAGVPYIGRELNNAQPAPQTNTTTPELSQDQNQTPTPLDQGIYGGDGGSGGMTAAQQAQNVDYINRAFDVKQSGFRGQLDTLAPAEQAANLQLHNQYTNKFNDLQTGFDQGKRNLGYATDQVQFQRAQSIDDIRRQMEQMHQSYNAQLGSMGAGDSSATGMINQALGMQSSRNRGDVMRGASDQMNQISMQDQDLTTSFESSKKGLDDWKQTTLNEIIGGFSEQRAQIQQAMANADLERLQQLQQYDAGLTQSVLDRLAEIDQMHKANTQQLIGRYQNMFAPQNIQIDPNLQQYAVQQIQPGQINQLQLPPQLNGDDGSTASLLKRLRDEQTGLRGV